MLTGTSPHFGFIENLRAIGLTQHDVAILDMPPPEAKAAFEAGYVDAWAIWPPFVEQELVAGKGKVLPHVVSPVQVVLAMSGRVLDADAPAVAAILKTLARAKAWLKDNPSTAQDLVSKELNLPLEVGLIKTHVNVNDHLISTFQHQAFW